MAKSLTLKATSITHKELQDRSSTDWGRVWGCGGRGASWVLCEFWVFCGIGEDGICGICLRGNLDSPCLKVEFKLVVSVIRV